MLVFYIYIYLHTKLESIWFWHTWHPFLRVHVTSECKIHTSYLARHCGSPCSRFRQAQAGMAPLRPRPRPPSAHPRPCAAAEQLAGDGQGQLTQPGPLQNIKLWERTFCPSLAENVWVRGSAPLPMGLKREFGGRRHTELKGGGMTWLHLHKANREQL